MANELTAARSNELPAVFRMPEMSFHLSKAISDLLDPHPDIGPPTEFSISVRNEAIQVGDTLYEANKPVSEAQLRAWVAPLLAQYLVVTGKPRNEEEIEMWLATLRTAVGHLAAGAFTRATQAEALRTLRFLPFAADIYAIVIEDTTKIRLTFEMIKRIVRAPRPESRP